MVAPKVYHKVNKIMRYESTSHRGTSGNRERDNTTDILGAFVRVSLTAHVQSQCGASGDVERDRTTGILGQCSCWVLKT